jgi:hypothetical protein
MIATLEVAVKSFPGQLIRITLACGFAWLTACTDSPTHPQAKVSGLGAEPTCFGTCDDARGSCLADCHADLQCAADCQATWRSCRLDCPDGSLPSPQGPIGSVVFNKPPKGPAVNPPLPPVTVGDAGLAGAAGTTALNGLDVTASGGINGINIGSAGIDGIYVTGVGGAP